MAFEYRNIIKAVADLGLLQGQPSLGQTVGGTHAGSSEHYAGRAVDFGQSNNDPSAIYSALVGLASQGPDSPIDELFYDPSGHGWKNGADIGPIGGHTDHVHVGVKPGVNLLLYVRAKPVTEGKAAVPLESLPVVGGVITTAEATVKITQAVIGVVEWLANPGNQKRMGMILVAFLLGLEALVLIKKGLA